VTRKRFHGLIAWILVLCVICPYVEMAIDWNESIFTTGYDAESAVAVIALLVILSLALASLLAVFRPGEISEEGVAASHFPATPLRGFADGIPEVSPPLSLRI
jgi:hypothetical protein